MIKMDDLNHHKNLYAGRGIEWMVEASFIAAAAETGDRHGLLFKNCHKFEFNKSVEPGEIISYCSTLVRCGRTSITIHVDLISEETGGNQGDRIYYICNRCGKYSRQESSRNSFR